MLDALSPFVYPPRRIEHPAVQLLAKKLAVDAAKVFISAGADDLIDLMTLAILHESLEPKLVECGTLAYARYQISAERLGLPFRNGNCPSCINACNSTCNVTFEPSEFCRRFSWIVHDAHINYDSICDCRYLSDSNDKGKQIMLHDWSVSSLSAFSSGIITYPEDIHIFSFSKYFAVPGIRISCGVVPSHWIDMMDLLQTPFPVSNLSAQYAMRLLNVDKLCEYEFLLEKQRKLSVEMCSLIELLAIEVLSASPYFILVAKSQLMQYSQIYRVCLSASGEVCGDGSKFIRIPIGTQVLSLLKSISCYRTDK